jgi:hypothetical protein
VLHFSLMSKISAFHSNNRIPVRLLPYRLPVVPICSCWPPETGDKDHETSSEEEEEEAESNLDSTRSALAGSYPAAPKKARVSCEEPTAQAALASWARSAALP